jgi:hypothetical protein
VVIALKLRTTGALELFAPELIHGSRNCSNLHGYREKVEALSRKGLRELRHILVAHLSVTAVRNSVVRTYCRLRFFPETQYPLEGISGPARSANRIYRAVTLPFLDASLSPTSLAEQPPSSSALRMILCACGSPRPPGRSVWPIVPSEQG